MRWYRLAIEFVYVSRRPEGLSRFLESVWYARGQIDYTRERIAPTGSTVAIIVLGAPIRQTPNDGDGEAFLAAKGLLLGPHDRPVINEPTGETFCLGVVTTPIGCQALFGVRPALIRGRVGDLMSAWPPANDLRQELLSAGDPERSLNILESTLADRHNAGIAGLDLCEKAVAALEADPAVGIGDLAAELGVSHGYLDREFTAVVGLSPRTLSRILRMRTLLASVDVFGPVNWTSAAAGLGWFDQSHFIRDFKRHTGVTPSQYLQAQREMYTPEQAAAGFIPQR